MFEVGDRVVVESIAVKNRAKYLGEIHTIREKNGDKYSFEDATMLYYSYRLRPFERTKITWWTDQELRLATIDDELDEIRSEIKEVTFDVEGIKKRDVDKAFQAKPFVIEEDSSWAENLMGSRLQFVVGYVLGLICTLVAAFLAGLFS